MKDEIRNALRLAREVGGPAQPGDESSRFVQEQLHSGEPQAPQYVPEADFPARASRAVEAIDRTAGAMNDMAARAMYMDSMQSPKGRSAAEIVTAPIPADPNEVSKQAVQQYRGGDRLGAAETMLGGMPQTGALRAYHYSPQPIEKFEAGHAGTGAGGASFGVGHYFGEKENDARMWQDRVNAERGLPRGSGHMHEVELDVDPERMIDYNKHLHEQPEFVRDAFLNKLKHDTPSWFQPPAEGASVVGRPRGDMIVPQSEGAMNAMREAGIEGVRYYDPNNSYRGYVTFSGEPVSVLRRYADGGEVQNALRLAREVGGPARPPVSSEYLPVTADDQGLHLDWNAGIPGKLKRAGQYFYDTMSGQKEMDPTSQEAVDAANTIAGGITLGAGASTAPAEALRMGAARPYRDPKSQYIGDWKWRPLEEVQSEIGTNRVPEHVENFGKFMRDMSDKAATERLDPEDAIKAYMITRSSIQREGRTPEKLASYGIPVRQTDEPLIRPEGHMADFLASPMGVRFLNEARKGDLSQDVVEAAQKHMKPFGMSSVEPDAMDWARRNLPERTPIISDLVSKAKSGGSSPSEWRGFTLGVKGIGPAKAGFLGSLLGRGDLPTLDARQAILHTGLKNAEAQKIMQKKSGRAGHEAVDRLAARQRAMNFELPEELQPFYQHLAHHTVWDAIGKERTTHQDIIDAMRPRADGGTIERKEWSPFRGLKIKPPAEKLSDEPDIREYQEKRHAHEFEGAPEPVAPRRPVVLDAPLFGGKKELGTLPYDYQPAVQKALNLIYGQKTLPLYAHPATAPIGRALDAYETAKFIQRDPTDIKNYTGVPGVLHGAGRAAAPAIGAGAGAGIVASDEEPKKRADGGPLPMRFTYGPRYGSTDLKDIGFRGPLKQPDGSVVSEYSSDRDFQYPSVYKGITDRDLATVMAHERMSAPKYRGEDEMSERLNAAQPRIPFPKDIDDRAYAAARQRVEAGRSPFYEPGHDPYPQWSPDQNWERPAVMRAAGGEIQNALRIARKHYEGGGATPSVEPLEVIDTPAPEAPVADAARAAYNEIPSPVRLAGEYAAGATSPVTEKDFPKADLDYMRGAVENQQNRNAMNELFLRDLSQSRDTRPEDRAAINQKLQSYENTRGRTSVSYPQDVVETNPQGANAKLNFYNPGSGSIPATADKLLNSPAYRTATTLGNYTAHDTPKGRVILDRYDFAPTAAFRNDVQSVSPYSFSSAVNTPVKTIRQAITDYAGGGERPVAINLDAQPGHEYAYTGPKITTPGSHSGETVTPNTDAILAAMSGQPGTTPKTRETNVHKKRAHGGEVADALRVARSKLASGGQPPLMEMLQKTAPGPMGAGKPMGGAPPMGAGKPMGGAPPMGGPGKPMGGAPPMGGPGKPPMAPGMMNDKDISGYASGGGAWTRKEGKSESGGLNEKGRASLRAQGHDIKRPQPEGGSRRDSFCARMKGMKKKLTSSETANDPNSRINKSLRAWNCADGGEVWDKPRPKDLGAPKHLSSKAKSSAKARAKAAGRPWPNLIDNMAAARKGK